MTAPSLEPPTADDLLAGRANLAREITQYVMHWELAFAAISVTPFAVEYQTTDHKAAVAVAEAFGAAPKGDRRSHVQGGKAWAMESWASDVLRVSWCKRLEEAVG